MGHRDPACPWARRGVMRPPGNGAGRAVDTEEDYSLNNNSNRNNNNRRRGRGNRNQGGGGGHQQNRIDSRARGNAPQLLDKYKKLAQDAAHNGDRVQAEYYLQFADHYFRVIADNKARQDEARGRRDERDYDDDDAGEFGSDDAAEQSGDDRRRGNTQSNNQRRPRGRRDDFEVMDRGAEGEEFSADDNPFVPDDLSGIEDRAPRAERNGGRGGDRSEKRGDDRGAERSERRPRRRSARDEAPVRDEQPASFDAAVLPPSISAGDEEAAKPRLKPRRRRPAGEAEEAVETVDS